MKTAKNSSEQWQWSFNYRPRKGGADSELIEYLISIPPKEAKEMALQAMRAYWRVTAAMDLGAKTDEEIRLLGLHCCNMLESHSDHIRSMLLLPPRVTHTIVPSNGHNMNPAYQASSSVPADRANVPKNPEKKVELSEKEN